LVGYDDPTNKPLPSELGGAVDLGPLRDPAQWERIPGEEFPPTGRHSTYWKHPKVDAAVAKLSGELANDSKLIKWAVAQ
jgi:hypothetical protein